jgi:hypothetical protein
MLRVERYCRGLSQSQAMQVFLVVEPLGCERVKAERQDGSAQVGGASRAMSLDSLEAAWGA